MECKIVQVRAYKVRLPRFFDMRPHSHYGRLSQLAFYGDPSRSSLAPLLDAMSSHAGSDENTSLGHETVIFHLNGSPHSVELNILGNNQILGACRGIPEFCYGYEPEISCAIEALTVPDDVIVDVGSNWGPITFQCALRPGFQGRIYSFEPQPRAFAMLRQIVEELGKADVIRPIQIALSDRQGEAFLSDDAWSGNVSLIQGNPVRNAAVACRTARLDDVMPEPPALIKIDVEGHEAQVIDGAWETIRKTRTQIIFEDWLTNPKQHFERLANEGYRFHCLGWLDPFADVFAMKPPMQSDIQFLAFMPFDHSDRRMLGERINVLAASGDMEGGAVFDGVRNHCKPTNPAGNPG